MTKEFIYYDEGGAPYVLDEAGNRRVPLHSARIPPGDTSDFTTYDTSQGHCGLCGSISCRGGCFK